MVYLIAHCSVLWGVWVNKVSVSSYNWTLKNKKYVQLYRLGTNELNTDHKINIKDANYQRSSTNLA